MHIISGSITVVGLLEHASHLYSLSSNYCQLTIAKKWAEYFSDLLNCLEPVNLFPFYDIHINLRLCPMRATNNDRLELRGAMCAQAPPVI